MVNKEISEQSEEAKAEPHYNSSDQKYYSECTHKTRIQEYELVLQESFKV